MKLRVTIDTDDIDFREYNSLGNGVFGIDKDGVYHAWYGMRTYLIAFKQIEVMSCHHQFNGRDDNPYVENGECYDCHAKEGSYYSLCLDTDDVDEARANMKLKNGDLEIE